MSESGNYSLTPNPSPSGRGEDRNTYRAGSNYMTDAMLQNAQSEGIHLLRFTNDDVLNRIEYVLKSILSYTPLPLGEGRG